MQEYENNYALEWYKYGRAHEADRVMHFMMMWLAFNWLYNQERYDSGVSSDVDAIRNYCSKHYDVLKQYKAFSSNSMTYFEEAPVSDEISEAKRRERFEILMDWNHKHSELERMQALLLTIYQVRCNLFHGSKSLRIDRNMKLVQATGKIMEGYLKTILDERDQR